MPSRLKRGARRALTLRVTPLALLLAAGAALAQEDAAGDIEWSLVKPLASRSLLHDGIAVDGLLVAVGERGHVLMSRDDGKSWQQVKVPTRASLTAVYFHDQQLGWVVGHDAVILRTRDGGESWDRLHWAPEEERPFLDVWFRDADHGFVIGAYGFFLRTSDGGDTWSTAEIGGEGDDLGDDEYGEYDLGYGADYHLNQIARAASGRLYIAAEAGNVYRSDDGGETWTSLPSPYEGSFFGVLPLADDSLMLFGLRGHLFRSEDGGETWEQIETGTQALLTDGLRLADDRVIIAGLAGTILVSDDGGRSFTLRQQPDRQGLATLLPAADGDLITVGEFGVNRLPAAALGGGQP